MTAIKNKIDFISIIEVNCANANGDPLDGNRPRTDYNGFGEISDVCIKRKIRNRMQDMGQKIFVQSDDRCDDGNKTLKARHEGAGLEKGTDKAKFFEIACNTWLDVRTFGQVFPLSKEQKGGKGNKKGEKDDQKEEKGDSIGIRGPVSIRQAVSVSPVEVDSMRITKSVSFDKKEGDSRGHDTMGDKHFVKFGVYVIKGSINVQLAEKTGFTKEDADILKECLRTLFVNDSSSARPDGSMEVVKLYWFEHNCKEGQYSSAQVHRSIKITQRDPLTVPASIEDYDITIEPLEGLIPEVIEGV